MLAATTDRLSTLATYVSVAALAVTLSLCAVAVTEQQRATMTHTTPRAQTEVPDGFLLSVPSSPFDAVFTPAADRVPVGPPRMAPMYSGMSDVAFLQRSDLLLAPQP